MSGEQREELRIALVMNGGVSLAVWTGILAGQIRPAYAQSLGACESCDKLGEHVALAAHQVQLYGSLQSAYDDLRKTQQAVMQQERLRS